MEIIDVTLRESVYYESGMTYEDRLQYLRNLCEFVPNNLIQYVEIGFIDNDVDVDLNYDEKFIRDAYSICKNKFKLVSMIHPGKADYTKWDKDVIALFDMVRIMVPRGKMESAKPYIEYFHELGVDVSCNILYACSVPTSEIVEMERQAHAIGADYFYCADSSGSFVPSYTDDLSKALIQNKNSMKVGLHLHDHMRMALANALIAKDCGIEITDVSILGAGKGGGNMKMEETLLLMFGNDVITPDLLMGLNAMIETFNNMVGQDSKKSKKAFCDFLVGVFKLNLKDIEKLEEISNGNESEYFKHIFEVAK